MIVQRGEDVDKDIEIFWNFEDNAAFIAVTEILLRLKLFLLFVPRKLSQLLSKGRYQ